MVRKKELKQRAIYVYPPAEMAQRWKEQAERAGASISKFVIEHTENSLKLTDDDYRTRTNIIEDNRRLQEALQEKEKRAHHLELLVEKLEEDLRLYRSKLFTDEAFTGIRSYDKKLVEILREPGPHPSQAILSRLGIKPNEVEAIKAVSRQLENLEAYGLVRSTGRGWTWTE
jgi:hypothetical protein